MAGTVMKPLQLNRSVTTSTDQSPSLSYFISSVVDRLFYHVHGDFRNDNTNIEFCRLCTSLSSSIDISVAKNEILERASDLPRLMKEVCQWQNGDSLLAAIMVLMISIKGACRNGWFSEKDNEELHDLWNEIATSFCSVKDMDSEASTFRQGISDLMLRFYPGMKMGETLVFVEAMPGYGAFVKDFHITKTARSFGDKIYLFVAQTDNTATSSCIISPQQVNILLNGKPVDMRTCLYKDPGPQNPTNVTHMLKYGTNLLQVVGQFSGKYIIAVAFMSLVSNPSTPVLQDYVPLVAPASNLDNDIIEGTSRISLNCPISFKRIKTPVKGQLCKHFQCFDFDNYVDINSRRPSWRCPHCSQSVCFTDIRIDQSMVKVLKEVGVNVSHVNISRDGSWETVNEGDGHTDEGAGHTDKQQDKPPLHHESTTSRDAGANILDLTEMDNDMDARDSPQENDRKPSPAQLQDVNMNNVHKSVASHMENQFQRTNLLTHENWTLNTTSDVTAMSPVNVTSQGQSQVFASNNMQLIHANGSSNTRSNVNMMAPVTDAVLNAPSQSQSQTSVSNNMQSQQHYSNNMRSQQHYSNNMQSQQNYSNNMNNGHGVRYPTPARQVTRIPIGVQALPVQTSAGTASANRQQRYRFLIHQHQIMNTSSAPPSQNMASQNWVHRDGSHASSQPVQQFGALSGPPPQQPTSHLHASFHPSDRFNSQQNQSFNHMTNSSWSSAQLPPQVHQGVTGPTTGQGSHQQAHLYNMVSAQRAIQNMSWTPPVPAPLQTSGSPLPLSLSEAQRGQAQNVLDVLANAPVVDPNWRPTGRMRGSLSGQAYEDAVNQILVHPTQPIHAARPPDLNTPRPFIPAHLQVLMGNNRNGHIYQDGSAGWC